MRLNNYIYYITALGALYLCLELESAEVTETVQIIEDNFKYLVIRK